MSKNPRKKAAKAQQQRPFGALEAQEIQPTTSSFGQLDVQPSIDRQLSDLSIGGDAEDELPPVQFAKKKYGTMGRPTTLYVNFFKMDLTQNPPNYFHYNIEIILEDEDDKKNAKNKPKKDSTPKSKKTPKRLNDEIFRALFIKYKNIFQCGNILPVFDGEKNFYSTSQFSLPNNQWSGHVTVKDIDKDLNVRVNITIPEFSHGQNLKNLIGINNKIMPVELQALDIIMRNGPRLDKISLGPNFFFKSSDNRCRNLQFDIGVPKGRDNMDIDPILYGQFGHYQSVRKCEDGLYYNVDRAMAVFSEGGWLIEKIKDIMKSNNLKFDARSKKMVEDKIKGLKFSPKHLGYKRTYIIAGLSNSTVRETTFKIDEGGKKREISVFDYFKKDYSQFCLKYPLNDKFPCVQVGSKNNVKYFPIEVCHLEEDEVYRRKLNPVLQGMVTRKSSQQTPYERFKNIEDHIASLEKDNVINNINYMKHFGVSIPDKKCSQIKGRILDAPKLEYNGGQEVNTRNQGQWEMKGVKFYQPCSINRDWGVINIGKIFGVENRFSVFKNKVDNLIKSLICESKSKGINLSDPKITKYDFNYRGKNTLQNDLFKNLDKDLKLLIILIPNKEGIYDEIKAAAELQFGVITQCLNQEQKYWRDDRFSPQLITNIFLKINPKCSGVNQNINAKNRPAILRSKLMIMGLDVTHPSPTDGLSKSVAAICATYTKEFDKCFHEIVVQEKARKEVVNLTEITKNLLSKFNMVNKFYPLNLIVYRDGIGEGDFQKIINIELRSIQKACEKIGSKIKITYIMVQKRHNTRFLPKDARPTDKRQNIEPGTVADNQITHHKFFEFYLCSHAGMMGTSRPTKYVVLHDDNDLSADDIQATTYYLCYLYPRCTKSSSIPPVVLYSHLLCKRGRSYLASLDKNDGQSSISSSGNIEKLSQAQINQLNDSLAVKENIQGRLFFI